MPKFEVHIPAAEEGGFNVTLKVDADNWMAALKAGMTRLGEQGSTVQNVMVDMQDDGSIHVTEPLSNRVFRIRELTEAEAAKATVKRPSQIRPPPAASAPPPAAAPPAPEPPPAAPEPTVQEAKTAPLPQDDESNRKTLVGVPPLDLPEARPSPGPATDKVYRHDLKAPKSDTRSTVVEGKTSKKPVSKPGNKSSPRLVEELEHPTLPVNKPIGRPRPKTVSGLPAPVAPNVEDMLADVFERVQEIHGKKTVEEALYFVLDLALEKVPADAGSVFRADSGSGDLTFAAARGPAAKELLASKLTVPAGEGIAGFCSTEGVSVALSDVQKDPRYYATIANKVDYTTKSIVCSPMMTHGRSFGCIQLLNRKAGSNFAEHEVGLVSYLAHQAALYLNDYA